MKKFNLMGFLIYQSVAFKFCPLFIYLGFAEELFCNARDDE